jgi:uncharacterized RDD family membrane protein YckC
VLADCLDAAFLFVVGWLLSIPFRGVFLRLGEQGVFVGLAISMLYSGLLHSRFGNGRTLGKRILGLRVVRPDGALLSLDRSLVRYALMGLLVYQGAVALALASVLPFVSLALAQTVLGAIGVALFFGCVLVVPFHPLKRGLHDLLAGTIVIRDELPDPVFIAARMNPRRDRRIVGGAVLLTLVAIVGGAVALSGFSKDPGPASSTSLLQLMGGLGISNAGLATNESALNFGPARRTVIASGFVKRPAGGGDPDWSGLHAAVMERLKQHTAGAPPGEAPDAVGTALSTGFNLGIFKSYETVVRIENARTGQVLQSSNNMNW